MLYSTIKRQYLLIKVLDSKRLQTPSVSKATITTYGANNLLLPKTLMDKK
jgi:hypothetical protein